MQNDQVAARQWPEVYDLCHTFLNVVLVRKNTDMLELHRKRVQFLHVSEKVCIF